MSLSRTFQIMSRQRYPAHDPICLRPSDYQLTPQSCQMCFFEAVSWDNLCEHYYLKHQANYVCFYCPHQFTCLKERQEHNAECHTHENLSCVFCGEELPRGMPPMEHFNFQHHVEVRIFKCPLCKLVRYSYLSLAYHVVTLHHKERYIFNLRIRKDEMEEKLQRRGEAIIERFYYASLENETFRSDSFLRKRRSHTFSRSPERDYESRRSPCSDVEEKRNRTRHQKRRRSEDQTSRYRSLSPYHRSDSNNASADSDRSSGGLTSQSRSRRRARKRARSQRSVASTAGDRSPQEFDRKCRISRHPKKAGRHEDTGTDDNGSSSSSDATSEHEEMSMVQRKRTKVLGPASRFYQGARTVESPDIGTSVESPTVRKRKMTSKRRLSGAGTTSVALYSDPPMEHRLRSPSSDAIRDCDSSSGSSVSPEPQLTRTLVREPERTEHGGQSEVEFHETSKSNRSSVDDSPSAPVSQTSLSVHKTPKPAVESSPLSDTFVRLAELCRNYHREVFGNVGDGTDACVVCAFFGSSKNVLAHLKHVHGIEGCFVEHFVVNRS